MINKYHNFLYSKTVCFIGLILYRVVLDYSYVNIVVPQWGYQGFMLENNQLYLYISWLFLILLSPLIVKTFRRSNISSNIMSVLILVSLVPITSIIAYSNYKYEFIYLNFLYWGLLLLLNLYIPSFIWKKRTEKQNNLLSNVIIIILSASVIFVSFKYTGFRLHFGIFDVYELRLEAREFNMFAIIGYLISAANTILPIIFIYFLIQKKKFAAILIAFIILLNFGIAGGKSVILLLFIALIGYFLVKSLEKAVFFVWGFLSLVVISILEFNIFNTILSSFFVTYRTLFLTSRINFVYYDFFSTREFDYFRQSILKWSGYESPYTENIAFVIGNYALGENGGRANNGLFSDAYSNFGSIGMIIFPFIVVIILKFIERSTKGLDERLLFIVTVATSMNLLSLTFSTALMTGGLLIMIIFLYSLPRNNNRNTL